MELTRAAAHLVSLSAWGKARPAWSGFSYGEATNLGLLICPSLLSPSQLESANISEVWLYATVKRVEVNFHRMMVVASILNGDEYVPNFW